jgi:hypothetical protein
MYSSRLLLMANVIAGMGSGCRGPRERREKDRVVFKREIRSMM